MRTIIAVLILGLVAGLGFLGWNKYQAYTEMQVAVANVRSASALMIRQSEMDRSDTVTFSEYFKKAAESIDEIDKGLLVLRTTQFARRADARDSAIEFSSSAQEIIRAASSQARSKMRASSVKQILEEARQEALSSNNEYTVTYATDRARKARDEQIEILGEMISELEALKAKNERMMSADTKVKSLFGPTEGLPSEMVEDIEPEKAKG